MGKAKLKKKIDGYQKQLEKHIDKFSEAEERGDVGSMNYMAREMNSFLERMEILKKRAAPKNKRKDLNKEDGNKQ